MPASDVRQLWIHVADWDLVPMNDLKTARVSLDLPYRIVPEWWDQREVAPDRILAFGLKPTRICDYYLVAERPGIGQISDALEWVLHERAESSNATTELDMLQEAMPGLREMSAEELESERRLIAYQRGLE